MCMDRSERRQKNLRVFLLPAVLFVCVLSITATAYGEEAPGILHWTFPESPTSYKMYGPIAIPSDGYLGYVVHYSDPDPDGPSYITIEVLWPYEENNCYLGNIPYAEAVPFAGPSLAADQVSPPPGEWRSEVSERPISSGNNPEASEPRSRKNLQRHEDSGSSRSNFCLGVNAQHLPPDTSSAYRILGEGLFRCRRGGQPGIRQAS